MAFFGQWGGNGAITYYLPVMLKQAGVETARKQLFYNGLLNVLGYPCAVFAAIFIAGRFPRRKVFMIASALFVVEFVILAALTASFTKTHSIPGSKLQSLLSLYSVCRMR